MPSAGVSGCAGTRREQGPRRSIPSPSLYSPSPAGTRHWGYWGKNVENVVLWGIVCILTMPINGKIFESKRFPQGTKEFRVLVYFLIANKTKLPFKNSPGALCRQAGSDAAGGE